MECGSSASAFCSGSSTSTALTEVDGFCKSLIQYFKTTPFNSPFVKGDLVEKVSFNDSPLKKGVSAKQTGVVISEQYFCKNYELPYNKGAVSKVTTFVNFL